MKVDHGKYIQIEESVNQVIILALNACILQHDNLFLQFYHIWNYFKKAWYLFVKSIESWQIIFIDLWLCLCIRFGEPSECAGTVSFLVSDDASYITGETILVTGGIDARL